MDSLKPELSSYVYEPLQGPNFIRILKLCGISETGVECTIKQIDVNQSTDTYQALSYVWGSDEKLVLAVVRASEDGTVLGTISLTTNLSNALHDVWNAEELESKVLWIDQICIDQGGTEKNHQVSMMGQIYTNAARVITYLGTAVGVDPDLEQRGIQLLYRLYEHFQPNYEKLASMLDASKAFRKKAELPVKSPPNCLGELAREETWQWIASVCVGEWTSRLWIVQEQLLNEVEVVMLRGKCLLHWEAVTAIAIFFRFDYIPKNSLLRYFEAAPWTRFLDDPVDLTTSVFSLWNSCRLMKELRLQNMNKSLRMRSLLSNLCIYEQLQCRDPHDRIFALLAISRDAKFELGIIPNYEEPAYQTFWRVSISILQVNEKASLDLLTEACQVESSSDPHCPLWSLKILPPKRERCYNLVYLAHNPHPYCGFEDLHERPRFQFIEDAEHSRKTTTNQLPSVLVLKGFILDTVSFSSRPYYSGEASLRSVVDDSQKRAIAQLLYSYVEVLDIVGLTLANIAAISRTLQVAILDHRQVQGDTQSFIRQPAYHFRLYILHMSKRPKTPGFEKQGEELDRLIRDLGSIIVQAGYDVHQGLFDAEQVQMIDYFGENQLFIGRCLGVTKHGRIFNAMNAVKPGDVIAAIQGIDRLFVLCQVKRNHRYRLVGDVYVDGLMQGEAYEGLDPQRVDYDIELI